MAIRGTSPTSALDAAAPAAPAASFAGAPLPEVAPAETLPTVEAAACLSSMIEVQAELAAVGLDSETIMRVAAERAGTITGADGVAVALTDGDAYAYRYAASILAPYAGRRSAVDAGVLGYALRTGEA